MATKKAEIQLPDMGEIKNMNFEQFKAFCLEFSKLPEPIREAAPFLNLCVKLTLSSFEENGKKDAQEKNENG